MDGIEPMVSISLCPMASGFFLPRPLRMQIRTTRNDCPVSGLSADLVIGTERIFGHGFCSSRKATHRRLFRPECNGATHRSAGYKQQGAGEIRSSSFEG